MNFLAPAALAASALSIPILLLYMLRLRRTEIRISSNFLWQHLVRDREANAPWQKLRFSWLLLLQLLILAALVLALARPFIEVQTLSAGRIILLLDASASMAATDVEDAENRFEVAQQEALALVDTLGGEDTMTVIRVADVAEVLISASTDQAALRSAIDAAQVGETSADWSAALTLAAARVNTAEDLQVVIISDGGLPGGLPEIPGEIRLATVGNASENLAISALATREVPGEGPQLFTQITNYGEQDARVVFDITLDGELFSAQRYDIPASQSFDVIVDDLPGTFDVLEAGLRPVAASDVPEYLAIDNAAYGARNVLGAGNTLLVTQRNIFLSQIFGSLPGVQLTQASTDSDILPVGDFDLYVFDGWLPQTLPDGDLFIINPPNNTELFTILGQVDDINATRVTDILPDDPRTQFLDFGDVNIRTFQNIQPVGDWADTLVEAEGGALLIAGEVDNRQVAILTFALQDSDLPLQLTFPILIANLTQWYTPPRALVTSNSIAPGEAVVVRALTGDNAQITTPDGETETLQFEESSRLIFADTKQAGIYRLTVRDGEQVLTSEAFAVNLFDSRESNITPQESVVIGTTEVSESIREEVGQRELWQYLAGLGLVILLVEWLYYHRGGVQRLTREITSRARPEPRIGSRRL